MTALREPRLHLRAGTMSLAKLLLLSMLPLALCGCCCFPPLSGRYGNVGPTPVGAADPCCSCQPCCGLVHGPLLAWLHHGAAGFGSHGLNLAPSEQHADYVSPLAKFHPVPTRPVFEPLPAYHPPMPLDPLPTPAWSDAGKVSAATLH